MRSAVLILLLAGLAACSREEARTAAALSNFLPGATVVGNDPTCLDCEIDIELVSDLAEARDKDAITGEFRAVLPTSHGIVVTSATPGSPLLFGIDGRLIRSIAGSESGDNFTNASLMRYGWGDSIFVYDEMAKRIAVLSPALRPVRFIPVSVPISDMALLADGDLILSSPRTIGDSVNPLLRISGSTGELQTPPTTSFRQQAGTDEVFPHRALALSRDGKFLWVAHTLRYAIEKRTLTGELVQTLERDVSWFLPSARVAAVSPDTAPTPRVVGLWEDSRGLLWIHTLTADRRWKDAVGTLNGVDGKSRYFVHSNDIYRDSRIEVIDPQSGGLVATAKFDSELPVFTPGPFMSRVVKGPSGWLVGEVWAVRFTGWSGKSGSGR